MVLSSVEQPSSVVIALSGGVDSSFSAFLLKSTGWQVYGLHFVLPAPEEIIYARKGAVKKFSAHLNIPLEFVDLLEAFNTQIIEPFCMSYVQGLTPNPCVICNPTIKFERLLWFAKEHGIHYLATGHYARLIRRQASGVTGLYRGKDITKDQSYFLHRLNQTYLSRAVFPLADMNKAEVSIRARDIGLPVEAIPESQDICFLPTGNYRTLVEEKLGPDIKRPGDIINAMGKVLGRHTGIYGYTIGQRHGLNISSTRPYYVKELRRETNQVVVGRKEDISSKVVFAHNFNWVEGMPAQREFPVQAQVRYRHRAAPGVLTVLSPDRVMVTFDTPQLAVTAGQSLCCYDGERVIGGGIIEREVNNSF
ncbi:tRNA-specific 2-thiouridylase MnmA [uncultured Desulfobacterium sp.]|uniref:tRNA-specific 2-thiouridylase MnmA n=1 Tax=uncultured Desulfobacterium sp. TaxID=201089 RepID=A0A445MX67_9BACT|nr:tRNA-specific 2-thiouridylase MnmA [uncultured Desulfobacterium sp.]